MTTPRKRSAAARRAGKPDALPIVPVVPPASPPGDACPPRRPTRARLQTYFLRQLARCGSVGEASARTGIALRTVQRWRAANPAFAARYDAVLAERVAILEDLAMRRALGADRRPIFHGGKQVATVERHNDVMLMRVLARFDRLRERRAVSEAARAADAPFVDEVRLLEEAGERARQESRARWQRESRARLDSGT